jgi:hypothetical protein
MAKKAPGFAWCSFWVRSCLSVKSDSVYICTEPVSISQEILRGKSDCGASMQRVCGPVALPYPYERRLEADHILARCMIWFTLSIFTQDASAKSLLIVFFYILTQESTFVRLEVQMHNASSDTSSRGNLTSGLAFAAWALARNTQPCRECRLNPVRGVTCRGR